MPKTISKAELAARLHGLQAVVCGRLYAAAREVTAVGLCDPAAVASRLKGLAGQAGADIERMRQELSQGRAVEGAVGER